MNNLKKLRQRLKYWENERLKANKRLEKAKDMVKMFKENINEDGKS